MNTKRHSQFAEACSLSLDADQPKGTDTGRLRCDPCGLSFKFPSQLERHIKTKGHMLFAEACKLSRDADLPQGTDIMHSNDYRVEEVGSTATCL